MDDNGIAVTRTEYLPFGETWFQEGDTKNAPKYNSQELDKESGYYFYNARHYDPEIARFVTPDTVIDGEKKDENGRIITSDTQGWNRYMYCRGNPIRYNDPTGHDWKDSVWKVADSIGEKISNVGEGIRSAGEKITQPLRDAGELLQNKLNSSLQNKANGTGHRVSISSNGSQDAVKPVDNGSISKEFNKNNHPGLDIVGPGNIKDVKVKAAYSGIVDKVGWEDQKDKSKGFGYYVRIKHKDGSMSYYGHLRADSSSLEAGKTIKAGETIGIMGNTGKYVTNNPQGQEPGRHLHFEIRKSGQSINPTDVRKLY